MTGLIQVDQENVPRGRGPNPFVAPIPDIAQMLEEHPNEWSIIGTGGTEDRSRLNNAAALLKGGKYLALRRSGVLERGHFETRVSGALNAPHAASYPVAVYARFCPHAE